MSSIFIEVVAQPGDNTFEVTAAEAFSPNRIAIPARDGTVGDGLDLELHSLVIGGQEQLEPDPSGKYKTARWLPLVVLWKTS